MSIRFAARLLRPANVRCGRRGFELVLAVLVLAAALGLSPVPAAAQPESPIVEVIDRSPPAGMARLNRYEPLHLLIRYRSSTPISFRLTGERQGEAITRDYRYFPTSYPAGEGLAHAWISYGGPQAVDRLVLTISAAGRTEQRILPVDLVWTGEATGRQIERPGWVGRLTAEQAALRRDAEPVRPIFDWTVFLIIDVMTPLGLILQAGLLWFWRGWWRIAAGLPLLVLGPALFVLIMGAMHGGNLAPLPFMFAAAAACAYLTLLLLLRLAVILLRGHQPRRSTTAR